MDATAATIVTMKPTQLNVFNPNHLREELQILAYEMYISIGKYTINGQNEAAPIKPKTLLKTGNGIAIIVVNITYTILHMLWKKFMLKFPTNGMTI